MSQQFFTPSTPPEPFSIGERIREARKQRGFSQLDLARKIGVTQPAVANWESGVHDPRRLMLVRIADALDVSAASLASGARSLVEADKHPAAAYLRRPIQHTPVISFTDAARFFENPEADPHIYAEDYIPVTASAERLFALIVEDEAIDLIFPRGTIVVVDYSDRRPVDGSFALFRLDGPPLIRRWRDQPMRLEPASFSPAFGPIHLETAPDIIGSLRVSIRIH